MSIELTVAEIEALLESVEQSKNHVRNAIGTPHDVRQERLQRLDSVSEKLRSARKLCGGVEAN